MQVTKFGVCTTQQILSESVVEVFKERVRPKSDADGKFVDLDNSLADPRMGPVLGLPCATCGGKHHECILGHYGHVDLKDYVLQSTYMPQVIRMLKQVCHNCLRGVVKDNCVLGEKCKSCGTVKDTKDGFLTVAGRKWSAKDVYVFFESVHPSVWKRLGTKNPSCLIATHMFVLPVTERVYTKKNGEVTVHPYTTLYNKLLMVLNKHNVREASYSKYATELFIAYNDVYYASISNAPGWAAKANGILRSIKSKEGVLRLNLMSKRVFYCGRAVIAGDYTLHLDEIGIPQHMRSKLTTPVIMPGKERATAAMKIRDIVASGEWSSILCRNGLKYDIEGCRDLRSIAAGLQPGDCVNRWMRDGDSTLFLRQPTLHKGSLMKFRVRIHEDENKLAITMNMLSTTPFNADCDGDEMNVFIPQTTNGLADIDELMDVQTNILNENGHVQIYPIQNVMLALYMLTTIPDLVIPVRYFNKPPKQIKNVYTGYDFVSNPFPDTLNCEVVRAGRVVAPLTVGAMKKIIFEMYMIRPDLVTSTMHELCTQTNEWVCDYGVSMRIDDFMIKHHFDFVKAAQHDFGRVFEEAKQYVREHSNKNSTMHRILSSESKGSFGDFANVALIVGQQYVENRPPMPGMGDRIFPSQYKGDMHSNIAKGIITNSYISGITPIEMALHAASAKDGIIVKAVKIKDAGRRTRDLCQRLESYVVSYVDQMVFDTQGNVVQWMYGEDGLDPKFSKLHIRTSGVSDPFYQEKLRRRLEEIEDRTGLPYVPAEKVRGKLNAIPVSSDDDIDTVIHKYERSKVEAGHAVGLNSAHCISEPSTQSMLNATHHSGSKHGNNSHRLGELFRGSNLKSNGCCTVHVNSTAGMERIELKSSYITKQKLKQKLWMQKFQSVFPYTQKTYTAVLVFYPGKTTREILRFLNYENVCASHHVFDGTEVTVIASSDDRLELEKLISNAKKIVPEDVTDRMEAMNLKPVSEFEIIDKNKIKCVGSLQACFMQFPDADHTKTVSTCADDILKTYGIEAARAFLLKEFRSISAFAGGIDIRHLLMMVDAMTSTGEIKQMDFHGMKGIDESVLGRATFQSAIEQLSSAAAKGVEQKTSNISECVISGRLCPVGSGYDKFEVKVDEDFHFAAEPDADDVLMDLAPPTFPNAGLVYDPMDESYEPNAELCDTYDEDGGAVYAPASPSYEAQEYDPMQEDYTPCSPMIESSKRMRITT